MRSLCFLLKARGAQAGRVLFPGGLLAKAPESLELAWSGAKSCRIGPEDCPHSGTCQTSLSRKRTEIRQSVPSRREQETPGSRPPRTTPSQIWCLPSGDKQKWPLSSSCQLKKPTDLDADCCSGTPTERTLSFSGPLSSSILAPSLIFSGHIATLEKLLNQEHGPEVSSSGTRGCFIKVTAFRGHFSRNRSRIPAYHTLLP